MQFSVTYDFGKPSPPARLLGALPGSAVPLGDDRGLWRAFDDSRVETLTGPEWLALQACDHFRSRDGHVPFVRDALRCAAGQAAALIDALQTRGLLLQPDAFIAPAAPGNADAPLPEPLIAIRTAARPEQFQRLLQSLLAHEGRHGSDRRYLVVDDAADGASAARCAQSVRDFAAATRSRVYRIGPEHRREIFDALAVELDADARHVLATLIDPAYPTARTGARGYNLAMLAAAGGALSLLDDDTVLPLRVPPGVQRAFDLHDSTANETGYLDDAPFESLAEFDGDAFATLRTLVGQPVATVLQRDGWQREALAGRAVAAVAHLRRSPRLVGAFGGIYGGIGFDSNSVLLAGSPASLQRLWRAPYRHDRLEGDRVWHGTTSPRITSYGVITPLLLDARELLPFTGTWGRADDTVFLALLGALAPRTAYAFMPLLLGHFPAGSRARLARGLEPLLLDRSALLAADFDEMGRRLHGDDRVARLSAIGALCADLAGASDAALTEHVVHWRETQIAAFADRLAQTLAAHPQAPSPWRDYATRVLAVNRDAMRDGSLAADELRAVRASYAQAATAARLWPQVWRRALALPLLDGRVGRVRA